MSKIARKLCDEIEAPTLTPFRSKVFHRNACNYDVKTKRNVVVIKQSNRSKSRDRIGSRSIKFKSEEDAILGTETNLVDVAVNTTIKGALATDKDCVTSGCKHAATNCVCPPRYSSSRDRHAKQVQTFNAKLYSQLSDKACFRCIETTSRGTQFLVPVIQKRFDVVQEITRRNLRSTNSHQQNLTTTIMNKSNSQVADVLADFRRINRQSTIIQNNDKQEIIKKIPIVNVMRARRWTLSPYTNRGPDF